MDTGLDSPPKNKNKNLETGSLKNGLRTPNPLPCGSLVGETQYLVRMDQAAINFPESRQDCLEALIN